MSEYICTENKFLNDVKYHQIDIIHDDKNMRFVRFRKENTRVFWFDLVTWPGHLCISGDCGTYVFSRIPDMFGFFRMDKGDFNFNKDNELNINPDYWGEKLQSISTNSGYKEFDEKVFRERVKYHFDTYMADDAEDKGVKEELWNAIENEVLSFIYDGEHEAYSRIHNFSYESLNGENYRFIDFFDSGSTESYTYNYIWCLYAVVWGIKKYDEAINKLNAISN